VEPTIFELRPKFFKFGPRGIYIFKIPLPFSSGEYFNIFTQKFFYLTLKSKTFLNSAREKLSNLLNADGCRLYLFEGDFSRKYITLDDDLVTFFVQSIFNLKR